MREIDIEAFQDFAEKEIYWYEINKKRISIENIENALQVILAKKTRYTEALAREKFGFTDEDFREALIKIPPGMFTSREKWVRMNLRFGIDPPLPFPEWDMAKEWEELRQIIEDRKSKGDKARA